MRVFKVAIATLFLGAVVAVGLIPSGNAQTDIHNCNCMVYPIMSYGYKASASEPCRVQACYIG